MRLYDRFHGTLGLFWDVAEVGSGRVALREQHLWLTIPPTHHGYSNAQITDYGFKHPSAASHTQRLLHLPGRRKTYNFCWKPPLRMTVRAAARVGAQPASAGALRGTAGFGFWNHPFSPDARRFPRLPQAIWFFFGSPPNNMQLALDIPGFGWKAAAIDAGRLPALSLIPLSPFAMLAMRSERLYRKVYPPIQRALAIHEAALPDDLLLTERTYVIEWRRDGARWLVDGEVVLQAPTAPRGKAGFVAWLDNQYAIVTPRGKLRFGIVPVEQEQSLVIDSIEVENL